MLSERHRIESAQQDPRRFAEIYEACFDQVYAYVIRRVHDRTEAEDITSEVFHQALKNIQRFEWRGAPFITWLFRIASNAIADRFERLERERNVPASGFRDAADLNDIQRRATLFRMVRELPDDQRRVIELRFVEQKSIREVAAAMDRSEGAVKQLQFRAIEALRDRVGGAK
jgi:RNA polymerase sigma-70 factor, ECF subfamily